MSHDEKGDDDWFNQDEEELLKNLKVKAEECLQPHKTEYIKTNTDDNEAFLFNQRLKAAKKYPSNTPRIPTSEWGKILESQDPLDIFLYAFTQENPKFFKNQIASNDSMDRVCLYIRILTIISDLKVPGFHEELIKNFTENDELLKNLRILATKMMTKPYKRLWATDPDKMRFDRTICDMKTLFIQASALHLLTPIVMDCIKHILKLIEQRDSPLVDRPACAEFAEELKEILTTSDMLPEMLEKPVEIYPTLDELLHPSEPTERSSLLNNEYKSVAEYLHGQRQTLRADFIISLASCVQELKTKRKLSQQFAAQVLLLEKVQIVLNEEFVNARRHEMLFIDMNPQRKEKTGNETATTPTPTPLKTGTLICLTTSYEFDDMILAVAVHQDAEVAQHEYIAIEIVRQFNIANVYNKDFIMFTSPAFFEPYCNVYSYLNTCSVQDFPMKDEIVFGKSNVRRPSYITEETIFKTERKKFNPTSELPPSDVTMLLNDSQRRAVQKALTQNFSLIQGPPGTGKSHVTVQLVKLLVENKTPKPIIVVAYTNESLDKFLLKLSAHTSSIVRLGGQTRQSEINKFNVPETNSDIVSPQLKKLYFNLNTKYKAAFGRLQTRKKDFDGTEESYQAVLKAQEKVREAREKLNTMRLLFQYYAVRSSSVVALTTTCAAKTNSLLRLLKSRIVFFEEAAEILESHVLACLTPHIEHIVMIGDHMQLKPFTSEFEHSRSCDLHISLFERLVLQNILEPEVLLTQYRMRPTISEVLCPLFYPTLRNDDSVEQYPSVRKMKENLFFVKHRVKESRTVVDLSVYNDYEAERIIQLALYLIKEAEYELDDLVILTPYAAQVRVIKRKLPQNIKLLRVMTVDSFQGLEATIVLLSLVRSNTEGRIGFLKEKNRVCVALSRAKHGLYVIGDLDLLASLSDTWRFILESRSNLIGEEFPYEKPSLCPPMLGLKSQ